MQRTLLLVASLFTIVFFPNQLIRTLQWVRAIVLDFFFFFLIVFLRVISLFPFKKKMPASSSQCPILLVHGYLDADFVWFFHKRFLRKRGFGPIYTINLGSPFASIDVFVEKVRKKAEEIAKETGRSDLVLIGHSMGGLVSTYYALQQTQHNLRVITIGSPLKGTFMAKFGLGRCAREMEIGSELLKKIQKAETHQSLYHIATTTDQLIFPYHSALLVSDPSKTHLFHDLGHIALIFSPRTVEKICEWLSSVDKK